MTSKSIIPNIPLDIDDDLTGSLDRQIIDQSPPLDQLESHSPILTYTSYFVDDTTNCSSHSSSSNYNNVNMNLGSSSNLGSDQPILPIVAPAANTTVITSHQPTLLTSSSSISKNPSSSATPCPYLATQRSYLFSLLTCPDMGAYLTQHDLPEDIYLLPLPLSTLLSEVKEEVIANHQRDSKQQYQQQTNATTTNHFQKYSALDQLNSLREFAWEASGHDISNMMPVLDGLTKNEDQLGNIIGESRLG